jgi:peptidoglycan/xylan/chitin deacetylase (PgdA/CDA1 family)
VLILEYHSVNDRRADALSVSSAAFEAQLRWLLARGWTPVRLAAAAGGPARSAGRLRPFNRGGTAGMRRAFAVTFDDGYRDNFEVAWPILSRLGVPATIFLVADLVDSDRPFPWDAATDGAESRALTWDMIDALAGEGLVEFGSHTRTHPDLTALDPARAWAEIRGSRERLEARLGRPIEAFCYPHSRCAPWLKRLVREAGYTVACRTGAGGRDPLELPRVGVYRHTGGMEFRFKVTSLGRALRERPLLRRLTHAGRALLGRTA